MKKGSQSVREVCAFYVFRFGKERKIDEKSRIDYLQVSEVLKK
jgi:hypothetical protein